jgi:threonylcarbamoyladenosine tRNA methylthiotransferase MtaB
MRRRYRTELYAERVHLIKSLMPEACIGVDVIVGFPGETEALFQDTFAFLQGLPVDYLHVFTYSERENTTAIRLDGKVPLAERKKRNKRLRQASEFMRNRFYSTQVGRVRRVLWEGSESDGSMLGYTENYVRVRTPYDPLYSHCFQDIRLLRMDTESGHMEIDVPVEIEKKTASA